MKAFHNDESGKQKYLTRVAGHIAADDLVRGTGWEAGKGCAIGCTLEAYDFTRYPIELGIPEWLARVEDTLFEEMSLEKSRTWPKQFLEAINIGADLETVKPKFLILVLESTLTAFDTEKFPDVAKVVHEGVTLWKRADIGSKDWGGTARVTAYFAGSMEEVARSWAPWAKGAAWGAAAAAEAARYAAEAGRDDVTKGEVAMAAQYAAAATWSTSAAEVEKFGHFADELLKMLAETY